MPEAFEPGTPLWWIHRLERLQAERNKIFKVFDDYYCGRHPLAFASLKFEEAFGGLFKEFADNWVDLVVDAVRERLKVQGFRFGDNTEGDKDVWRIWQANRLDADSQIAHTEALINGEVSVLVWAGRDSNTPEITIEHPSQMVVEYEAGSRRRRVAALKKWVADDGYEMATLYLPDGIYKYRSATLAGSALQLPSSWKNYSRWAPRESRTEAWPLPNPLGVVPVVRLVNKERLLSASGLAGESEIRKVIPLQDAVNKLVADMLVASEFGAFRQRWATGIDIPKDPATGLPLEPFKAAADRLWVSKKSEASFGEFSQTDLTNFVKSIEMLVQHVASQTRTPPHYFYLRGEFPSGESIKAAETGLVAKAREKMLFWGEEWEEVMRLALMVQGSDRAAETAAETIWGDPESRSESEHTDALVKQKSLGIPDEILWEKAGYTQQEITRIKQVRAEQGLLDGLLATDSAETGAG